MKIVYIYGQLPAYRKDFFNILNKSLKEKGHTLKVLYGNQEKNESLQVRDNLGFDAIPFQIGDVLKRGSLHLTTFKGLIKMFEAEQPDICVSQFHVAVLTNWRLLRFMRKRRIPYIVWDCNYLKPELGGKAVKLRTALMNKVYNGATGFLTYGTKFRDYLLEIGRKPEDIIVAQNTINVEKILENRSSKCNNRDYNHPLHVLYVGGVNNRKNVEQAIEAISCMINEGRDLYFDVVGGGDSYDSCQALIAKLGMSDRIVMHGPKHGKEVQVFFENSDLFLMPGTGGLAINEAMAYSLPIISTEGDGTVVDLIDGNGFLLQRFGDVKEIKETIEKFISLSDEEKKQMAKRSEEITRRFSLDNLVNKHIEAIEKTISK